MRSTTCCLVYILGVMVTGTLMFEASAPLVIDKEHNTIAAVTATEVHRLTKPEPDFCSGFFEGGKDHTCSHLDRDIAYIDLQGVAGAYAVRLIALLMFAAAFLRSCVWLSTMGDIAVSFFIYGPLALLVPDLVERVSYAGHLTPFFDIWK